MKSIWLNKEWIVYLCYSQKVPHDYRSSKNRKYHCSYFSRRDLGSFFWYKVHDTIISEKNSRSEYNTSFKYCSESLYLSKSIRKIFRACMFRKLECESIDSWNKHIHKGIECWSKDGERSRSKSYNCFEDGKNKWYNEGKSDTKRGCIWDFYHIRSVYLLRKKAKYIFFW